MFGALLANSSTIDSKLFIKSQISRKRKRCLFECKLSCIISNWQVKNEDDTTTQTSTTTTKQQTY